MVSGSKDNNIIIWNQSIGFNEKITFSKRQVLKGHTGQVNGVSISDNKLLISSCSNDGSILKWRFYYEEDKFIQDQELREHDGAVLCLSMSRDERVIVTGA